MGKHKEIIWTGIIILVLMLGGAGAFVWYTWKNSHAKTLLQESTAAAQSSQGIAYSNANGGSMEIQDNGPGGTPLSNQSTQSSGSQQVAGASTSSPTNEVNKLLDPSTFTQYDKYKDSKDALFIDLQKGDGTAVASGSKVAVYYKGWLTNGQLFDQSQKGSDGNLQPFMFTEGQHEVIAGWEESIFGMKQGGVRLFIVPPAVGYGAQGQGSIPGNAVLIFQVQLVAVQ